MATLYEIDSEIFSCVDEETGEIIDIDRLAELQIEREKLIENAALWYKNCLSDAEQYKAEKMQFAKKQQIAENNAERLKKMLDYALAGTPYKSTRVNISYRASKAVVIDDIYALDENYIRYAEPTADKTEIKKAIERGETISGAHIESKNNIQIK